MSVQYYPGYSQTQVKQLYTTHTITAVSNSYPCVVTTLDSVNYVPSMKVTFLIPFYFGMIQLNDLVAKVISVTGNNVSLDLDSSNFTPFLYPSYLPTVYTYPSIIPSGSGQLSPPSPLPYANQDNLAGTQYNDGAPGNQI